MPASRCTNACAAADQLARDGINARVIDLYSVKPIDADTLRRRPRTPRAGGSSSPRTTTPRAVSARPSAEALLARWSPAAPPARTWRVRELPGSGTTAELLAAAGIDAAHITSAAAALIDE